MRDLAVGATACAVLGAALALGACHPPHAHTDGHAWIDRPMSVGATLTCPQDVGGLNRTAQAADGQTCGYVGRGGEQVELKRLMLAAGQTPQAALEPTEAALQALVPPRQGPSAVTVDAGDGDGDDDHAKIDLPGVHINAQGDRAQVKVFGVTVDANGDNANVNVGQGSSRTVIQAGPNGAVIHTGEVQSTNAKLAFIVAADRTGPSAYRAVGYLARGPVAGPLVVATFKATDRRPDWRGDHDLNALLALNVKQ